MEVSDDLQREEVGRERSKSLPMPQTEDIMLFYGRSESPVTSSVPVIHEPPENEKKRMRTGESDERKDDSSDKKNLELGQSPSHQRSSLTGL